MGDPTAWPASTQKHSERLLLAYQDLLAAYYHRDHIERIASKILRAIRDASPAGLAADATSSMRMPIVGHEFVAYLLAARRTLDYLARSVASVFERPGVYKIT